MKGDPFIERQKDFLFQLSSFTGTWTCVSGYGYPFPTQSFMGKIINGKFIVIIDIVNV